MAPSSSIFPAITSSPKTNTVWFLESLTHSAATFCGCFLATVRTPPALDTPRFTNYEICSHRVSYSYLKGNVLLCHSSFRANAQISQKARALWICAWATDVQAVTIHCHYKINVQDAIFAEPLIYITHLHWKRMLPLAKQQILWKDEKLALNLCSNHVHLFPFIWLLYMSKRSCITRCHKNKTCHEPLQFK